MSSGSCNSGCTSFRPHADKLYVVCIKCGEIYLKVDIEKMLKGTNNG